MRLAKPLVDGLAYAHLKGLEHRDIKPGNILIDFAGRPLLADFGIAKLRGGHRHSEMTVQHYRSGPYAPPELDAIAPYVRDVYSIGVVLLQCLSREPIKNYPDVLTALDLIPKKRVEDLGYIRLPAERKAHVSLDDVTPAMLNALLRTGNLKALQVLQIHKISTKRNLYLPVQLLVYADQVRGEIELAVCIDDEISDVHGLALDRVEVVKNLRMSIGEPIDRPLLDAELESQREAPAPLVQIAGEPIEVGRPAPTVGVTAHVRSVSVFEHPDLLVAAVSTAERRLLIIAPWVRRAVVTTDFLSNIEARLRRGVEVTVAHGYGVDDSGSDDDALRRLENLAARYEKFEFVRVRNTHAKILIFDDNWVSTSFNWLSFRGDPNRTYRMEEGTLVSIPSRVQQEYERYRQLIEEQRLV